MSPDPISACSNPSAGDQGEEESNMLEASQPTTVSIASPSIDVVALLASAGSDVEVFGNSMFADWLAQQSEIWEPPLWAWGSLHSQRARLAVSIANAVSASKCRLRRISGWPCYTTAGKGFSRPASSSKGPTVVPWFDMAVAAGTGASLWDEMPEQWIAVPCPLPEGDFVSLKVSGDSMEPLLHNGDVVLVQRGSRVTPNDVVIARIHDDEYVVKRIGEMNNELIELRSVNSDFASVWISGSSDQIVGRVLLSWCGHDRALPGIVSMSTGRVP